VPLTWLFYVIYQVYGKVEILKKYAFLAVIYLLVNISTVVVNLFFGFYYQIDANNVYAGGDFYAVSILLSLAPLVVAFFLTVISRNKIDVRKYNAFVFFPLSPVVGTILSFFTYGYSIVLPSMMIAYLLVFNSLKNDTMRTDYLTGVFNRRHLEDILRRKISESNSGFGAIMIDIDNYKSINDTHGHLVGDRALIDFANALQKSVGSKDFVARYGGDEFMIVVETKNKHSLEDVVASIKNNITRLNEQEIYPFKMNGSMGQDLYVPEEKMTMEQFINHLDNLMYKDKKTKR
jgi:diguanylate cyclase (GGDEF)-like protein